MTFKPPGSRAQDLDRRFDQTQLKSTGHGRVVHRDYAAHFFRWGFAGRWVKKGDRVLDIGCGQEWPLVYILGRSMTTVPGLWVGVDLNKIRKKPGVKWTRLHDEFNIVDEHKRLVKEYGQTFDLATCFEVIEHMHPPDGLKLLRNIADLVKPDGTLLLSTPVYDGRKMAANHLHEYKTPELAKLIERSGRWTVKRRFGTFASWPELKRSITPADRTLYEELHKYYSHDVLSCFLAPKYPDASRNNVWVLSPK